MGFQTFLIVELSIVGEPLTLRPPLELECLPKALRILVPPQAC